MAEFLRKNYKALCFSSRCTKNAHHGNANAGQEKDVSIHTIFCPDCKSALVWQAEDVGHRLKSSFSRRGKIKSDQNRAI